MRRVIWSKLLNFSAAQLSTSKLKYKWGGLAPKRPSAKFLWGLLCSSSYSSGPLKAEGASFIPVGQGSVEKFEGITPLHLCMSLFCLLQVLLFALGRVLT